MNSARYCLLLLALLFRKIANMRIFHSERSNQENTYTLLYFAGILLKSKTTEGKMKFSIHFSECEISRKETRCEVSKIERGSQNTRH